MDEQRQSTQNGLKTRHQRFIVPAFLLILKGKQTDLKDRFVIDVDGNLSANPDEALIVDAEKEPQLFCDLNNRFYREFWSPVLGRWV